MGKALAYLEGHWDALRAFMFDGHLEIDNGAAERALRGIAVERRNWLFAGSDAGAERAVIIYSVIESAVRTPGSSSTLASTTTARGW